MRLLAPVLLAMVLSACTLLGHQKVPGWPQLAIVEHYVSNTEMRERCAKYVGFGMSPARSSISPPTAATCGSAPTSANPGDP